MTLTQLARNALAAAMRDPTAAAELKVILEDEQSLAGLAAEPYTITVAAAAGAANICNVTFTVTDVDGNAVACVPLLIWLSDAATGLALTSTSASGTVQAESAPNGFDFAALSAKKALLVGTNASGVYILEITDTAKTTFYPCAVAFGLGVTTIGTILATGDYG